MKENQRKTKKVKISIASAKAKGRRLQQFICTKISDLLNIPWGKDELIASREMGQSGTDIRLIGTAKKRFPYSVECKWQETWSIHSFIEQAKANQIQGTDWLLFCKRNSRDAIVILDVHTFFSILKSNKEGKNGRKSENTSQ